MRFCNLFILILFLSQYAFTQSDIEYPFLEKRFEISGASLDSMWEYGFNLAVGMDKIPNTKLRIRLCSKEDLPFAITTSAVPPLKLTRFLMTSENKPEISINRIFIDRSKNCINKSLSNTPTELWLTNRDGQLCDFEEKIKPCQIDVRELKSRKDNDKGVYVGTFSHKSALEKFKLELEKDAQLKGVVLGYYVDKPTEEIKQKLLFARKFLKNSNLSSNRFRVKLLNWTGLSDIERPKYLEFRLIKINKSCEAMKKEDEVLWIE